MYEFGSYRLEAEQKLLLDHEVVVPLTPKAFEILLVLLERAGKVVTKEELLHRVWPDAFVEEGNLTQTIFMLRKALSSNSSTQYIETVPRRGYRFSGHVRVVEEQQIERKESVSPAAPGPSLAQGTTGLPTSPGASRLIRSKIVIPFLTVSALIVVITALRILPADISHAKQRSGVLREAETNYQEGRLFWKKRTAPDYRVAIAHFQEAIRLDPNYAQAYAGIADSYILLGSFGIEPLDEVIPRARAAALRAIEIDDRSAEAHASMGYIMSRFDWNWEEAEREFKRAIELDPAYTTAHQWYALHLITLGRNAEAISEIKRAQTLDPASLVLTTDTALVLFYARRYDEAIQECRKALSIDSSFGLAHRTLGAIYAASGMYRKAIAEFELATKLLGRDPWIVAEIGRSYALMGDHKKALAQLNELWELSGHQFVSPSAFALLSAALQETRDESFQWLEKEYEQHSNLATLTVHPGFDPIRQDPRFEDLLKRIGLPQS